MDSRTRYDEETGAVRSFFGSGLAEASSGDLLANSAVSNDFLASNPDLFRLEGIDLVLSDEKDGGSQITCKYEQFHKNIPVYGAYVNVTLRKSDRQVISLINRVDYGIRLLPEEPIATISNSEALQFLHERYDPDFKEIICSEPELLFFHQLLAWQIGLDSDMPRSHLEVMISAMDGTIVAEIDRRRFYASRPAKIFWPDPVTSSKNSGLHRGSPISILDAEQTEVELENLDDPIAGVFYLKGKWVKMAEKEQPALRVPSTGTDFNYSFGNRNFLSVMAYYYIDRLVEWLRSLDIPAFNDAMTGSIQVDAQGVEGADNSHFAAPVTGPVYIAFGEGGTPDASDPGVVTHEFGHALHYFLLSRLAEAGSFEEGFNDFLSCVFRDRFNVHGFDRANPFPWDNNSTVSWDTTRRCDMKYRFDDRGYNKYGFYKKGTVYATALWDIYLEIGGKSTNAETRLKAAGEITATCLEMLIAVGDTTPITDLANGLISSDQSRSGGKHEKVIREAFRKRGLW